MDSSKNKYFSPSFIMELAFVSLVTIVSMISLKIFTFSYHHYLHPTPQYSFHESQIFTNSGSDKGK